MDVTLNLPTKDRLLARTAPVLALLSALIASSVGCRRETGTRLTLPSLPSGATRSEEPPESPEALVRGAPGRSPSVSQTELVVDRLKLGHAHGLTVTTGGRWLIAAASADLVQVIELASGRVAVEQSLHPWRVCGTPFVSPNGRVLLVSRGGEVRAISTMTGVELETWGADTAPDATCALSVDGTRAIVASNGAIAVHSVDGSVASHRSELPFRGRIDALAASAEAEVVFVGGKSRTDGASSVVVNEGWLRGGVAGRRWRAVARYGGEVPQLTSSGALLVGLGPTTTVAWSAATGEAVAVPSALDGHHALAMNGSGDILAQSAEGRVTVSDVGSGQAAGAFPARGVVVAGAVSDDASRVALLTSDGGRMELTSWVSGEREPRFRRVETEVTIHGLRYLSDGQLALHVADTEGRALTIGPASPMPQVAASPARLATDRASGIGWTVGERSGGVTDVRFRGEHLGVVEVGSTAPRWEHRMSGPVFGAALDPAGRRVVALVGAAVVLVDAQSGQVGSDPLVPAEDGPLAIATHPRAPVTFVAHRDGTLSVRDLDTRAERQRTSIGMEATAPCPASTSPDGGTVVFLTPQSVIVVQNPTQAELSASAIALPMPGARHVAVAPGGSRVAVSDGARVIVIDPTAGRVVARVQPLSGDAIVSLGTAGYGASESARPFLRWRRGEELLARDDPATLAGWTARLSGFPL